jgi:hypothetical protein
MELPLNPDPRWLSLFLALLMLDTLDISRLDLSYRTESRSISRKPQKFLPETGSADALDHFDNERLGSHTLVSRNIKNTVIRTMQSRTQYTM